MMIPCIMIVFMIVLSFSSKVYAGRRMNTCEDALDSSSEFSCQDAELGILYGVISSCTEDLSKNSFVQQSAPGTTGTLCDVCCATCTNEFYASPDAYLCEPCTWPYVIYILSLSLSSKKYSHSTQQVLLLDTLRETNHGNHISMRIRNHRSCGTRTLFEKIF